MAPVLVFLFGAASGIVLSRTYRPLLKSGRVAGTKIRRKVVEVKEGVKEDIEDLTQKVRYKSK